jgi:hypothetical protein
MAYPDDGMVNTDAKTGERYKGKVLPDQEGESGLLIPSSPKSAAAVHGIWNLTTCFSTAKTGAGCPLTVIVTLSPGITDAGAEVT